MALEVAGFGKLHFAQGDDRPLDFAFYREICDFYRGNNMAFLFDDDVAGGGKVADGVVGVDLVVFEDKPLVAVGQEVDIARRATSRSWPQWVQVTCLSP